MTTLEQSLINLSQSIYSSDASVCVWVCVCVCGVGVCECVCVCVCVLREGGTEGKQANEVSGKLSGLGRCFPALLGQYHLSLPE